MGRRLATSAANVGPESTPRGAPGGSSSAATSWRRRPLDGSSPLVAHNNPARLAGIAARAATNSAKAWLGTATRHAPAAPTALESTGSTAKPSGRCCPGRYFSLLPWRAMAASPASSRPHRRVLCPLRASKTASAVPHEPAPSTATSQRRFIATGVRSARVTSSSTEGWRLPRPGCRRSGCTRSRSRPRRACPPPSR